MASTILKGITHKYVPAKAEELGLTLLLLHGTGGDENDLLPLGAMLSPGAALLSPRGKVVEAGAFRFFRRLSPGVFDLDDLHKRTQELADFVRAAGDRYPLAPGRMIAVGFSNGANIAASLMLTTPEVLDAAVLFRPMVPFEPETPPPLAGRAAYLGGGRLDPLVPQEDTERLAKILRGAGAEVTLEWQPAAHTLTKGDIEGARKWLRTQTQGPQSE